MSSIDMYQNGEELRYGGARPGASKNVTPYTVLQREKITGSIAISCGRCPFRPFQSHSVKREPQFTNEERHSAIRRRQGRPYHIRNHFTSYHQFQY
jgi:hypothetical protein